MTLTNTYPSDIFYNIFRYCSHLAASFLNLRSVSKSALIGSIAFTKSATTKSMISIYDPNVNNEFLRIYDKLINWKSLDILKLSGDTITEFASRLNLNTLISKTHIPAAIILANRHRINPNLLFAHQPLTIELVDALHAESWIPWQFIHSFYKLGELDHAILAKYSHLVNWNAMAGNNDIPSEIMRQFADHFNWRLLIKTQHIPHELLVEYLDRYDINTAIMYQDMPEEIIDANIGAIDWCIYSRYRVMTIDTRKKYEALICYRCLAHNRI